MAAISISISSHYHVLLQMKTGLAALLNQHNYKPLVNSKFTEYFHFAEFFVFVSLMHVSTRFCLL